MNSINTMQASIANMQQQLNNVQRETSINSKALENASLVVAQGEREVINFEKITANEFDKLQRKNIAVETQLEGIEEKVNFITQNTVSASDAQEFGQTVRKGFQEEDAKIDAKIKK